MLYGCLYKIFLQKKKRKASLQTSNEFFIAENVLSLVNYYIVNCECDENLYQDPFDTHNLI